MGKKTPRRKAKATPAPQDAERDQGTPELQAKIKHQSSVEGSGKLQHRRNLVQLPMDYYFRSRGLINKRQKLAGDQFARDFRNGGLEASLTPSMALLELGGGGGVRSERNLMSKSESQLEARQTYRQARDSISGEKGRLLAENVCCYGFAIAELEDNYYNTPSSLMARFREALDDLAEYYQIPESYASQWGKNKESTRKSGSVTLRQNPKIPAQPPV